MFTIIPIPTVIPTELAVPAWITTGSSIADNYDTLDEYSTTISAVTSTMSLTGCSQQETQLNTTTAYIESLSDEQLLALEQKLNQKENEIRVGNKVFKIEEPNKPNNIKPKEYKKI